MAGKEGAMPADPRRRQKKLERRAAKRKEKRQIVIREQAGGIVSRLTTAARFPVLHSIISETVWKEGLGWVLLSRALPDGTVAFAIFLVDRYCLGVKNVVVNILNRLDYESKIEKKMRSEYAVQDVPPEKLRKFVEQAVAYADGLGFAPVADYDRAKILFDDIDPSRCTEEFEFGKDGKPFFIAGPNDTMERSRMIISTLMHTCGGPDKFHYLIPLSPDAGLAVMDGFDQDSVEILEGPGDESTDED